MIVAIIIVSVIAVVLACILGYFLYLLSHFMDGW